MSSDEFISIPSETPDEETSSIVDVVGTTPADEQTNGTNAATPAITDEDPEAEIDRTFDTPTVTVPREAGLYRRSLQNAVIAARCADEMRARDIVVLDMTRIASIVDFFVIATGTSRRQMHAIADEVNRKLKGEGHNERLGMEGYRTEGNWILMDFGDIVLHVFTEEGRDLYDLENLKADAERVDWQNFNPEQE